MNNHKFDVKKEEKIMIGNVQPILPPPPKPWGKKFPSIISSIFCFIQFGVTVIIIGCEVGSMLIDIVTATIYVGLWASLFFTTAWISQAISSCCCRNCGFATYTLIIQIISMFFAVCVMGFDSYYIVYPSTCFFNSSVCNSTGSSRGVFYSTNNFNNIKIPLIKGQLAAGAVMFVLCLIYVIIYIITTIRVYRAKRSPNVFPQPQNPYVPPVNTYPPPSTVANGETRVTLLVCPSCNTTMTLTASKRPPA